jgi:hypothetical protein
MQEQHWLEKWWQILQDEVQKLTQGEGSPIALGVVGVFAVLLILLLLRRALRRGSFELGDSPITEHLAEYPPPPAQNAERLLTLYGMPARLRLVVAAPLGKEASKVDATVPTLLDRVVPGLGQLIEADMPRVRVWPTQLSHQGFNASFRRFAKTPAALNNVSRWVLLMGRVFIENRPIGLGLALLTSQENTLGRIVLEQPHDWMQALRIKTKREDV